MSPRLIDLLALTRWISLYMTSEDYKKLLPCSTLRSLTHSPARSEEEGRHGDEEREHPRDGGSGRRPGAQFNGKKIDFWLEKPLEFWFEISLH